MTSKALSASKGQALLGQWRKDATDFRKLEAAYKEVDTERSIFYRQCAELCEKHVDQLDYAFGRLS